MTLIHGMMFLGGMLAICAVVTVAVTITANINVNHTERGTRATSCPNRPEGLSPEPAIHSFHHLPRAPSWGPSQCFSFPSQCFSFSQMFFHLDWSVNRRHCMHPGHSFVPL